MSLKQKWLSCLLNEFVKKAEEKYNMFVIEGLVVEGARKKIFIYMSVVFELKEIKRDLVVGDNM